MRTPVSIARLSLAAAAALAAGLLGWSQAGAAHAPGEHVSQGQINGNELADVNIAFVSDDGRRVIFHTSERLAASDTDGGTDVYERFEGTTTHLSRGNLGGNGGDWALAIAASADASRVFFITGEQLMATDTDKALDLYERAGGVTTQVSQGAINGNGTSDVAFFAVASADGNRVFFITDEQLAPTDTDTVFDVYERSGGQTIHVSQGEINGNGNAPAFFAGSSADGSRVFFITDEQLASTDTDGVRDVYERSGGQTIHVSQGEINGNGPMPAFSGGDGGPSAHGNRVFFETEEQLAPTDTDGVTDIYERSGGQTIHVSQGEINGNGNDSTSWSGASADGGRVFFETHEQLAPTDNDNATDVYSRSGGQTTHVSRGQINGNDNMQARFASSSADGNLVFFITDEQLAPTDTDGVRDVYERSGGQTIHVSRGEINGNGNAPAFDSAISADGNRLFFQTAEQLALSDTDTVLDVYERSGGRTTHVSQGEINGDDELAATFRGASADGRRVFFETHEPLAASDTDKAQDIYSSIDTSTPPGADPEPGPEGEPKPTPQPEKLSLELRAKKRQRALGLRATVTSSLAADVRVRAKGRVGGRRVKTKKLTASLEASAPSKLRLRFPKPLRRRLDGERGKLTIVAGVTAGEQNAGARRKVRIAK